MRGGPGERSGRVVYGVPMIGRITGRIERVSESLAVVVPPVGGEPGPIAYEVLVPGFLAPSLADRAGQSVTLVTLHYLESQNQGASYVPRLIGFEHVAQREFFELFTTVKGIGNRKALRALAREPADIAGMIAARDLRGLSSLPEIGKRMAETICAELNGKVERFLIAPAEPGPRREPKPIAGGALAEAIAALTALGETPTEADRKVRLALERLGPGAWSVEQVISAVFQGGNTQGSAR